MHLTTTEKPRFNPVEIAKSPVKTPFPPQKKKIVKKSDGPEIV
jgi:hypothetical protein